MLAVERRWLHPPALEPAVRSRRPDLLPPKSHSGSGVALGPSEQKLAIARSLAVFLISTQHRNVRSLRLTKRLFEVCHRPIQTHIPSPILSSNPPSPKPPFSHSSHFSGVTDSRLLRQKANTSTTSPPVTDSKLRQSR